MFTIVKIILKHFLHEHRTVMGECHGFFPFFGQKWVKLNKFLQLRLNTLCGSIDPSDIEGKSPKLRE